MDERKRPQAASVDFPCSHSPPGGAPLPAPFINCTGPAANTVPPQGLPTRPLKLGAGLAINFRSIAAAISESTCRTDLTNRPRVKVKRAANASSSHHGSNFFNRTLAEPITPPMTAIVRQQAELDSMEIDVANIYIR
jgi:hypothetical protein